MTVSTAHRFLYGRNPQNRIWVLHGNIQDLYYHNVYHGCIGPEETLALWARENGMARVAVLTRSGDLEFDLSGDPDDARRAFESAREPVQRRGTPYSPEVQTADGTAARQGEEGRGRKVADQVVSAAGGDPQKVRNNLTRIAAALREELGLLVIIRDFQGFMEAYHVKDAAAKVDILQLLTREIHGKISPRNLLVLPAHDHGAMQSILPKEQFPDVEWIEPGPPNEAELVEVLDRLAARGGFSIGGRRAIGQALMRFGFLKAACNCIAGSVRKLPQTEATLTLVNVLNLPPVNEEKVAAVLAELDKLVGLDEVKSKALQLVEVARQRRQHLMNRDAELPEDCLHMVFTGSPGTGKTTVARIIARLFNALGLLEGEKVTEVTASTLMRADVGQTREEMQKLIESARGGVLFIDEAPQLGDQEHPQAKEAIQALLPWSWNYRTEMVIILAGYAARMPDFFAMDEGLERRFPRFNRIEFPDYNHAELWEILVRALGVKGLAVPESVAPRLRNLLQRRASRSSFGNAGGVVNLVSEILANRARRRAEGATLEEGDLPPLVRRHAREYDEAMAELNSLQGLGEVREQIERIMNELEVDLANLEAGLAESMKHHPGNFRFLGPPGTGKTTVARIMGRLLYGLGCIERSTVGEHRRDDIVGKFVGHTAPLVRRAVEQDRDGVFFLDEAYQLNDPRDPFCKEAIGAIVGEITARDNAGTVFIFAGYEDELNALFSQNPGIGSRVPMEIRFRQFDPSDCSDLFRKLLRLARYSCGDEVLEAVRQVAGRMREQQGRHFGNARWVTSLASAAMTSQKQRVLRERIPTSEPERRMRILIEDLPPQRGA